MKTWRMMAALAAAIFSFGAVSARAEVEIADATGFVITHTQTMPAPKGVDLIARFGQVGRWWSSSHTYSGDAGNLSISLQPGGCWCEGWPGGFVRHMTVEAAVDATTPEGRRQTLRLSGALGPLADMGAHGVMVVTVKTPAAGQTAQIRIVYRVQGRPPQGADWAPMAKAVDSVLGEALTRFVGARFD
jgi:hypothetical protein